MLSQMAGFLSFSWLHNTPSSLFLHLLMDILVVSTSWLLLVISLPANSVEVFLGEWNNKHKQMVKFLVNPLQNKW